MAKFKITVKTDKIGSKAEDFVEIPDEDLAEMTDKQIEEVCLQTMFDMIDWNYERLDDEA